LIGIGLEPKFWVQTFPSFEKGSFSYFTRIYLGPNFFKISLAQTFRRIDFGYGQSISSSLEPKFWVQTLSVLKCSTKILPHPTPHFELPPGLLIISKA
jgi:hypothetical protein